MLAKSLSYSSIACAVVMVCSAAHAAIIVNGTRVIYPANKKDVTVQVKNDGTKPSLMQVWMDDGDASITPDKSTVPFVITPPVSRVDPKQGQTISISYINANLPQDRESVFWINVLDIPSKPKSEDTASPNNYLQISIRSRIKLFYRPENLKGLPIEAPKALQWKLQANQINVTNPTPYYVSFANIKAETNTGSKNELIPKGLMIAPFQSQNIELNGTTVKKLSITSINDYGGTNNLDVELKH
ncbi:molecular chaperone [Acinetobacter gerneri]|uniref:fimbrial biogenesis chaperone n=1 Tax=Acinetobacter gerneri TaxID=202952 RepID=UPI003AF426D4